MNKDTVKTATIFRTFKHGNDCVALFPFIPSDRLGHYCLSYMHVGQHGSADPNIVQCKLTRPATAKEATELRAELERLGYNIRTLKRIPRNALTVRMATKGE